MSVQHIGGITEQRRERAFREALTYGQFIAQAEVNVERFEANFGHYTLNEDDEAYFAQRGEPVHVLALAHDWCGDVVASLPLFAKIESETGKLKLHILPRDPDNRDIAEAYLHADGRNHIPTYVFFSEAGRELGVFIERPELITALIDGWHADFWNRHPELAGRGQPVDELESDTKKALFGYIKEQRLLTRQQEKNAVIEVIRSIIDG